MHLFTLLAILLLMVSACGAAPPQAPNAIPATSVSTTAPTAAPIMTTLSGNIMIFAASSLTNAFETIGAAFKAVYPTTEITFNFASGQQLANQIAQGAPADVFATANRNHMQLVIDSGDVVNGADQLFARNRLVVITSLENPANITTFQDLAQPGLRLILGDSTTSAGQNSLTVLARASALPAYTTAFSPTVLANVVSYESTVRAVLAKIVLGEGDAGIVFTTDAAVEAARIQQIAIPDDVNVITTNFIAPIAASPNPALAQAFVAYVLSAKGQKILASYGFIPIE
ncbi:MAG: molybdate ABC transporter substrate-binding protein [Chloroflexaceae bacterium]